MHMLLGMTQVFIGKMASVCFAPWTLLAKQSNMKFARVNPNSYDEQSVDAGHAAGRCETQREIYSSSKRVGDPRTGLQRSIF
jgi:hypothetical protein